MVAEVDGRPVGFLVITNWFFGQTFVELVYVADGWRRRGIGTALVGNAEADRRHEKLVTSTNASNAPMRALLEARGWLRSGFIDNLDEGDPELVYFKMPDGDGNRQA